MWVIFAEAFWGSWRLNYSCSAAHVYHPCRQCRVVVRDTSASHATPDDIKTQVVVVNHLMAWHQYPHHFSFNMQISLLLHPGVQTVQEWPFQPRIYHQQKWSYIKQSKNVSSRFPGFQPCTVKTTRRRDVSSLWPIPVLVRTFPSSLVETSAESRMKAIRI